VLRRFGSDPNEDWSMELRAWSPERRQEQAKRRAMAEALLKAKEEEEQRIEEQPIVEKSSASKPRADSAKSSAGPSAVRDQVADRNGEVEEGALRLSEVGDPVGEHCKDTSVPTEECEDTSGPTELPAACSQRGLQAAEASGLLQAESVCQDCNETAASQTMVTVSDIDDMCLSEVEEILGDKEASSRTCVREHPQGEVASLLIELADNAGHFDSGDYWVDGAWDLEALREDAEQQRQERWAHEEGLWRRNQSTAELDTAGLQDSCPAEPCRSQSDLSSRERSPSPEYPIFSELHNRGIAINLSRGSTKGVCAGSGAKQNLMATSLAEQKADRDLGIKLRLMLGA